MDEEGDELFPDLNNLSNRTASTSASTSKATSTFDFPLDPSLFGPGLGGNGQYLNEGYEDEDEDEDDDEGDDSLDEDGEDDSSEDETDAEDEYRAGFADDGASRGVKRGRSSVGEVNLAMRKGKGKHTELLADVGGAEEGGEEELGFVTFSAFCPSMLLMYDSCGQSSNPCHTRVCNCVWGRSGSS